MTIDGSEFIVNHNTGGTVGCIQHRDGSAAGMADCQRDDLMLEALERGWKKP